MEAQRNYLRERLKAKAKVERALALAISGPDQRYLSARLRMIKRQIASARAAIRANEARAER